MACNLFQRIAEERDPSSLAENYKNSEWASEMPWIYYKKGALPEERKELIDIKVAFDVEQALSS